MLQRILLLALFGAFLLPVTVAYADAPPTPRPTRLPTPLPGGGMMATWMTPPAVGPTQADAGAILYYYNCMACHGDKGQGLTVEWRAQWDVEHQNCARSGCHGSRPPPEGFSFPKNFAPAIMGANTLVKYENAQSLYDFVHAKMPYQSPGSLSEDEYWQLVAYIVRQHGVQVAHLDKNNAQNVSLDASNQFGIEAGMGAGVVVLAVGVLGALLVLRRHRSASKG